MKIFIRTGSFYQAEVPHLTDDLEITDFLSKGHHAALVCNCKQEVLDLTQKLKDLTEQVNAKTGITEPVETEKQNVKKAPAKKK